MAPRDRVMVSWGQSFQHPTDTSASVLWVRGSCTHGQMRVKDTLAIAPNSFNERQA